MPYLLLTHVLYEYILTLISKEFFINYQPSLIPLPLKQQIDTVEILVSFKHEYELSHATCKHTPLTQSSFFQIQYKKYLCKSIIQNKKEELKIECGIQRNPVK